MHTYSTTSWQFMKPWHSKFICSKNQMRSFAQLLHPNSTLPAMCRYPTIATTPQVPSPRFFRRILRRQQQRKQNS